ncbi:ribonuclease P protein subunit [Candidatus Bathyarchaeota archaeon]|nr:MAG: ribonuclease P protein subunit [Candidatus Bathyarchaeota archaeon]
MKVTPSFLRHEFIGLEAKIVKSSHPGYVGLTGKIIDETKKTLVLLGKDGKKRIVPKENNIFHFKLNDGTIVEVDGKVIVGRPEERLKRKIRRLW